MKFSGMTKEQFETHKKSTKSPYTISVEELEDKTPRTLILGYLVGREDHHVYLDNMGLINVVTYLGNNIIYSNKFEEAPVELLVPTKRTHPEATDFEFAQLLTKKGFYPTYANYDDTREKALYYGKII